MGKQFFDVFPTLKVQREIENLFEEVEVTKVTTTSSRDYLRIHTMSTHLIPKVCIFQMERMIKEQLFGRTLITIQMKEHYSLSEQYTPENLMKEYRESILEELKEKSIVEHNMFLNAKYTFENGNILCLTLADTIVAKGKQDSIVELIKEIFNERCGVPIEIRVMYEEVRESKHRKYNEIQLQQAINAIVEGNESRKQEHVEKEEEKEPKKETAKEAPKEEKKGFPKKNFRRETTISLQSVPMTRMLSMAAILRMSRLNCLR